VSSSQLALMHQYAEDVHPEILTEVMHSQVMVDAFGGSAASSEQTLPSEGHVSH
jgi:hypothetical protein